MSVHFHKMMRRQTKKRQGFTIDEDDRLKALVMRYGEEKWELITSKMPKRSSRQCRERWMNYLSPTVKNCPWSAEEDDLLRAQVLKFGHRWRTMSALFPGRTDINLKNRWNLLMARSARAEKGKEMIKANENTKAKADHNSNVLPVETVSQLMEETVDEWDWAGESTMYEDGFWY